MQQPAILGLNGRRTALIVTIAMLTTAQVAIGAEPKVDHEAACKVGRAENCLALAVQLYKGEGRKSNKASAAKAFERGCELGNKDACTSYAMMLIRGDGVKKDLVQSLKIAERGCEFGSGVLCAHAAKMWLDGPNGLPKDIQRALGLLDKACNAGEVAACGALCIGRASGEFGPPDLPAALKACRTGCTLSDAKLCLRGADLQRQMLKQPGEAVDLYERGCSLQSFEGCRTAAGLLLGAEGVKVDVNRARSILGVCCANKHGPCCKNLERLEAYRAKQAGTEKAPRPAPDRSAPPPPPPPDLPPASRSPSAVPAGGGR